MKMTSLIVHPLALVVLSLIESELLWLDQGVEEINEEPERQQCNYPCHKNWPLETR
jgi:hypothetical protein